MTNTAGRMFAPDDTYYRYTWMIMKTRWQNLKSYSCAMYEHHFIQNNVLK